MVAKSVSDSGTYVSSRLSGECVRLLVLVDD